MCTSLIIFLLHSATLEEGERGNKKIKYIHVCQVGCAPQRKERQGQGRARMDRHGAVSQGRLWRALVQCEQI